MESAASALCAELEHDGLPVDQEAAERTIASFLGPRPADAEEAARQIEERDKTGVFTGAFAAARLPDLRRKSPVTTGVRRCPAAS